MESFLQRSSIDEQAPIQRASASEPLRGPRGAQPEGRTCVSADKTARAARERLQKHQRKRNVGGSPCIVCTVVKLTGLQPLF